ncbi:ABC transporter substrate-binding protein [Sagittula sp. M10.9X]|uniref:ABC transporter substrate-binding protein n=2 Tax=Sagittula salina TaxID=2820268 RepID=A0A940MLS0_9RHOB|nr:ABC transporter substrate-binding protein [Sagittula salina]
MRANLFTRSQLLGVGMAAILAAGFAQAEPNHGIAMYGEPALPPDFASLPYADADAPHGGKIVLGEVGSFDSLNPHILKGTAPWQLRFLAYESLMGRSYDEPFSLYGVLAESIEVGPNREWAEFVIRPEAKFSDGSPVTVEDVMWSYEVLGTKGHGRYRGLWGQIEKMEQTGERSVRFTFNEDNRELALIVGMRPILKKAQWEGLDFENSSLDIVPITSAPYVIGDYEAGRFVELKRNPDYWGKDVPFMKGQANLDTIRMEFFADDTAHFEAFKGGVVNSLRETNVEKWRTQYDFPAVQDGRVVKSEIPHARPYGIYGFVMNTRKPEFSDWRVREAMLHAFNFEYINDVQTGGSQPRISSYYGNSVLGMDHGPAAGRVKELLEPFRDSLLPGALEGYILPEGDGTARNRSNIAKAMDLMADAGWTVQGGVMKNAAGTPFVFDILIRQGQNDNAAIADIFVTALERLGITASVQMVDSAQYQDRTNNFDFDMTYIERSLSLSPGNEQVLYWGSEQADQPGSRNWMGMKSPAADAMIQTLLSATSREDFVAATKALDRVLTTGRYVIPIMYRYDLSRIAHAKELKYPDQLPMYGDWLGFQPDVWYWEE